MARESSAYRSTRPAGGYLDDIREILQPKTYFQTVLTIATVANGNDGNVRPGALCRQCTVKDHSERL